MKPYACYPNTRGTFRTPYARFGNPYFAQSTQRDNTGSTVSARPSANIIREDGAYRIQLAVPGLTKEQIKIELHEGQLIITGEKTSVETQPKFIRQEFDYSGFKRTFKLHKNADTSAMTATVEQGLLSITIPDASPETIKINIQ